MIHYNPPVNNQAKERTLKELQRLLDDAKARAEYPGDWKGMQESLRY